MIPSLLPPSMALLSYAGLGEERKRHVAAHERNPSPMQSKVLRESGSNNDTPRFPPLASWHSTSPDRRGVQDKPTTRRAAIFLSFSHFE